MVFSFGKAQLFRDAVLNTVKAGILDCDGNFTADGNHQIPVIVGKLFRGMHPDTNHTADALLKNQRDDHVCMDIQPDKNTAELSLFTDIIFNDKTFTGFDHLPADTIAGLQFFDFKHRFRRNPLRCHQLQNLSCFFGDIKQSNICGHEFADHAGSFVKNTG